MSSKWMDWIIEVCSLRYDGNSNTKQNAIISLPRSILIFWIWKIDVQDNTEKLYEQPWVHNDELCRNCVEKGGQNAISVSSTTALELPEWVDQWEFPLIHHIYRVFGIIPMVFSLELLWRPFQHCKTSESRKKVHPKACERNETRPCPTDVKHRLHIGQSGHPLWCWYVSYYSVFLSGNCIRKRKPSYLPCDHG